MLCKKAGGVLETQRAHLRVRRVGGFGKARVRSWGGPTGSMLFSLAKDLFSLKIRAPILAPPLICESSHRIHLAGLAREQCEIKVCVGASGYLFPLLPQNHTLLLCPPLPRGSDGLHPVPEVSRSPPPAPLCLPQLHAASFLPSPGTYTCQVPGCVLAPGLWAGCRQ